MSKLTKAQLADENAALRKQIGDLLLERKLLQERVAQFTTKARVVHGLPAHMQAAKDLAMRSGMVVKAF